MLNSRLSPLNSQLKKRLVSKLPGLFIRIGYPAVGLEKTKKKVNDLKKNKMSRTNFDTLLEAGCHFGHLKRKWNPAMAPYIFMERNGIHIIDLNKTVAKIDEAAEALKQIAKSGKKVLFVATKKQAKQVVAEKAQSVNMPYVTNAGRVVC